MSAFSSRMEDIRLALQRNEFSSPEEFTELSIALGKRMTLAAVERMLEADKNGLSELEIMAATPFALAFLVTTLVHGFHPDGDATFVERLLESVRTLTHRLGDGAPSKLPSARCFPDSGH